MLNDKVRDVYPVHAVKVYTGSKGLAPLILKFRTIWSRFINFMTSVLFTPGNNLLNRGPGEAQESYRTFWRREKSFAPAGIRKLCTDWGIPVVEWLKNKTNVLFSWYKKGFFFRSTQADGAWNWPLIPIYCRGSEFFKLWIKCPKFRHGAPRDNFNST